MLEESLPQADCEIQIAAYRITRGANGFLDLIADCLSRGVKVSIIVNRFEKQPRTIKERLLQLLSQFRHFCLFDFCPEDDREDLHAKLIVIDRSKALVGSSNMTWRGLVLNHELGVIVEGPSATQIGSLIDALIRDPRTKALTA
jgi:cardiolipin synthase